MDNLKTINLKNIGARFLDGIGANRNKAPPDDVMVTCKKQLSTLREELVMVQTQFAQYAQQVVEAAEASVTLAKSVGQFYSHANHPGRTESVNTYRKVQEGIAQLSVNTFHISVENGLISELTEWVEIVNTLAEKIESAESTRISAHDTHNRLLSLQNEFHEKKTKKATLFGGNREQDLDDLQQRITEASDAQKSLSEEYNKAKQSITQQTKQLMERRYKYFDRIYVQMLECQVEYFQHAAVRSKQFQRSIDYYRKQYPKSNQFRNSNGALHLKNVPQQRAPNSPNQATDATATATTNASSFPSEPNTTATTTSDTSTAQSTSSATQSPSPQMSPDHRAVNGDVSHGSDNDNDHEHRSTSAQAHAHVHINGHSSATPPHHRQQSEHDMLFDMNATSATATTPTTNESDDQNKAKKKKPPANLAHQDSMFGAIIGSPDDPMHDEHDLLELGNPQSNDLLNGFGFDDAPTNHAPASTKSAAVAGGRGAAAAGGHTHLRDNSATKGTYSQSTSALRTHKSKSMPDHQNNDIFDDFFSTAASQPTSPNMAPARNSGADWLMNDMMSGSDEQPTAPTKPSTHDAFNQTHEEDKSKTFVAAKEDLSTADKQAMVNMALGSKGQAAAEKAYNDAMEERKQKEQQAMHAQQQKSYYKDLHEQKLKEWEYDHTVRRNIRTLIQKLPDVLPADFHWKPIPLTKLVNDADLKKGYYKAVRIVHPDKSQGRGDAIENQVICDYVFQALEQAFNTKFG
eukprot:CAMPEP_0202686456 /NCGR_PEP_ID=MMETSP1385-20130828/2232_1 /ASSEMBLY_ACC=CAM_ASM_000861 /TAXON_ID=933848 /ORGANISM="Elphidium margaritaceum" /LENGTH=744 /DNA_ID=CAMNT_0049341033 /DNA_START=130 /DNA_END=2364 /DNA_ORIENTATION=+